MEPCPSKPGVIFNIEETPVVVEHLRAYVENKNILHTCHAREILEEVSRTYSAKYGYSGGIFLPADEAMVISWTMRKNAEETSPNLVYIGALGMQIALKSLEVNRELKMANQIERTVRKSLKQFFR